MTNLATHTSTMRALQLDYENLLSMYQAKVDEYNVFLKTSTPKQLEAMPSCVLSNGDVVETNTVSSDIDCKNMCENAADCNMALFDSSAGKCTSYRNPDSYALQFSCDNAAHNAKILYVSKKTKILKDLIEYNEKLLMLIAKIQAHMQLTQPSVADTMGEQAALAQSLRQQQQELSNAKKQLRKEYTESQSQQQIFEEHKDTLEDELTRFYAWMFVLILCILGGLYFAYPQAGMYLAIVLLVVTIYLIMKGRNT